MSHIEGPADIEGRKLRGDLEEKLRKLQEPANAKTKKALPVPEEKKRSKRGGKRIRKMKERFAVTDLQKLQNKMEFKPDVGEYGDSAMGFDNGMVGSKVLCQQCFFPRFQCSITDPFPCCLIGYGSFAGSQNERIEDEGGEDSSEEGAQRVFRCYQRPLVFAGVHPRAGT